MLSCISKLWQRYCRWSYTIKRKMESGNRFFFSDLSPRLSVCLPFWGGSGCWEAVDFLVSPLDTAPCDSFHHLRGSFSCLRDVISLSPPIHLTWWLGLSIRRTAISEIKNNYYLINYNTILILDENYFYNLNEIKYIFEWISATPCWATTGKQRKLPAVMSAGYVRGLTLVAQCGGEKVNKHHLTGVYRDWNKIFGNISIFLSFLFIVAYTATLSYFTCEMAAVFLMTL